MNHFERCVQELEGKVEEELNECGRVSTTTFIQLTGLGLDAEQIISEIEDNL